MEPTQYEKDFTENFQNVYINQYPDPEDRPMTFFDITIDSKPIGRIIFELFTDIVPKTCENFRQLCISRQKYESYYQTPIHRIIPDYVVHGGDITRGDGRGGWSIYGNYFEDENFKAKHKIEGLLTMANKGPNTNNSQFMITLYPLPWLDGKHVVFGRVIKGYDVVRKIEECGSQNGKPKKKVMIANCGEIGKHFGLKINKDSYSFLHSNYFGNQNNTFIHNYGSNFGNENYNNLGGNGVSDSGFQGNESLQNSNLYSNNNNSGFMGSNFNNSQNNSNMVVNTFSNNGSGNNSFPSNLQNNNSYTNNNSESNFQNNSNFQESSTFIYNYNDPNNYNNIP